MHLLKFELYEGTPCVLCQPPRCESIRGSVYALRTEGVHPVYSFCWILDFRLRVLGHLLGLKAWAHISLPEYECFRPSEELYIRIRPNKEFGTNLENWANNGPCINLGFWIKKWDSVLAQLWIG